MKMKIYGLSEKVLDTPFFYGFLKDGNMKKYIEFIGGKT